MDDLGFILAFVEGDGRGTGKEAKGRCQKHGALHDGWDLREGQV
jgi:hypothetical protein